jgi:D-3-phosphoglycerate dehydrogenase
LANVIVLFDRWIKPDAEEMWRKAFSEELGGGFGGHDVCFVENLEGDFEWSTIPKDGVKEAKGDSSNIKKHVRDADAVVTGYAPLTMSIMEEAPRLRVIGVSRGGPVNVDLEAATSLGIMVLRTVGRNAVSVADQTLGMILSESRNISRLHHSLTTGRYFKEVEEHGRQRYMSDFRWMELEGKKLGLIGYGQVGKRVAVRAKAFGMSVMVYDPFVDEGTLSGEGCTKADLDDLLDSSDFVSIHARLTSETKHMIDDEALKKMKPTAILVNTARGEIIDEVSLVKALKENWIAGAALDVFEYDPIDRGNQLLSLDNVTLTPHSAGRSPDTEIRGYHQIARQVTLYLRGEEVNPIQVVNKSVLGLK